MKNSFRKGYLHKNTYEHLSIWEEKENHKKEEIKSLHRGRWSELTNACLQKE